MIEVRTPAAPVETVTPIKPSEALRLGRLTRPQASFLWEEGPTSACACGAIGEGWGLGGFRNRDAVLDRLKALGIDPYEDIVGAYLSEGGLSDAAVLAYLADRGL